MVGDGGDVGGGVVGGHVADRALPVRQRPADVARAAGGHLLVGQDLVDRRSPEVAVGRSGGGAVGELEDWVVAVVGPELVGEAAGAGPVGVDAAADEAPDVIRN